MLVKTYRVETVEAERWYSPAQIISAEKVVVSDTPGGGAEFAPAMWSGRTCTSTCPHAGSPGDERFQPEARQPAGGAGAHFAAYNFTWMHSSIRCTPTMAAEIARKPWRVRNTLIVKGLLILLATTARQHEYPHQLNRLPRTDPEGKCGALGQGSGRATD